VISVVLDANCGRCSINRGIPLRCTRRSGAACRSSRSGFGSGRLEPMPC